ncbi:MAG: NOL1/NOP2/fmu family ribosome biogenesis protein [Natronomonas sp.]|jgi:NOL1/NOP2/fmu family ribosome biogenesis protein
MSNDGQVFNRLPATAADREVEGRATREEVIDWWVERFDLDRETFAGHTFWEKGAGKIWAFADDMDSPADVEGLGMTFLRTRQEHWKPTTDAVQRFGREATKNVIVLDDGNATAFLQGEDQELDWDGDWGYLIAAHEIAGVTEPIGVALYVHGELRSQMPKGRQRDV